MGRSRGTAHVVTRVHAEVNVSQRHSLTRVVTVAGAMTKKTDGMLVITYADVSGAVQMINRPVKNATVWRNAMKLAARINAIAGRNYMVRLLIGAFGSAAIVADLAACGSPAPVVHAPLAYKCAVSDNASETEHTGMTELTFTVTVINLATYAQPIPTLDVYVQDYAGAAVQGPYPFPIGASAPVGTSMQILKMESYAEVTECTVASAPS
jgi:hypothetical protein